MTATMATPVVRNSLGQELMLGELIGRGGEGSVYALAKLPQRVAKIYHKQPDDALVAKLEAMVATQSPALLQCTAWPLELLYDYTNPETVIGFVMPRIQQAKPLHVLYGPKSRKQHFPHASFAFLAHVAANTARLFAAVHQAGHVIGDVNHGNLLIGPQGTVWAIDCDSFQIHYQDQVFTCDVGVMTHQPPELQHVKTFRGTIRTSNHDRFGLAVLIFQLMMMGRHPFAGKTSLHNELTLEEAIEQYRYVYSVQAKTRGILSPPGAIPIQHLPDTFCRLFERAFAMGSASDFARPKENDWIDAIDRSRRQLKTCPESDMHQFYGHRAECIWCEWESQKGIDYFPEHATPNGSPHSNTDSNAAGKDETHQSDHVPRDRSSMMQEPIVFQKRPVGQIGHKPLLDVHAIWQRIQTVPIPEAKWQLPRVPKIVDVSERPAQWRKMKFKMALWNSGLAGSISSIYWLAALPGVSQWNQMMTSLFGTSIWIHFAISIGMISSVFFFGSTYVMQRKLRRMLLETTWEFVEQWQTSRRNAQKHAKKQNQAFLNFVEGLAEVRTAIVELPEYRVKRMREWMEELPQRQLNHYLSTFRIQEAHISGIGEGRKMTLQSFGIETAADLNDELLQKVPGIGAQVQYNLMEWRNGISEQFVPNPLLGLSKQDHVLLDREVAIRRDGLLRKLDQSAKQLEQFTIDQKQMKQEIFEELSDLAEQYAQWLIDQQAFLRGQKGI